MCKISTLQVPGTQLQSQIETLRRLLCLLLERIENWKDYFKKLENKLRMAYLKKIRKR